MRANPYGWVDYLPADEPLKLYRTQSSNLTFNSDHGPYGGSGSWDASEEFNSTYDEWGNLTVDGTWSEEWHDSFFSPPENPANDYTSETTVDAEGCLSGSESGYKDTVSLRNRYDCPTGAGCTYHGPTTSKTAIDESDACTPTSGPGAIWTFERHLSLSDEITSADLVTTIDSLLPDINTLPWGSAQVGVVRRFKPESACSFPGSWEDTSTLNDELTALEDLSATAGDNIEDAQNTLSAAEEALNEYLSEWNSKHNQWRNESVSRCNGEGALSEEDWSELQAFIASKITNLQGFYNSIAAAKVNLDDAQQYKQVADFHVSQKEAQIGSITAGSYAGYMESGSIGGIVESSDETGWPAWVDKSHAQARVRVELGSPSQGETFEVKIGDIHTFTVEIPEGDYFGFTSPYTYDETSSVAVISVKNITSPP